MINDAQNNNVGNDADQPSAMTHALQKQLTLELFGSLEYLQLSSWCSRNNYPGFAKYFLDSSNEERHHALMFFDFLNLKGVSLGNIVLPECSDGMRNSLEKVFEYALELEMKVTQSIVEMYDYALSRYHSDIAIFLQWFVTEQTNAINEASFNLQWIYRIKLDSAALLLFDKQLGTRG